MLRDRRAFLSWLTVVCSSVGLLRAQAPPPRPPQSQPPRDPRPSEDSPALPPGKAVLKDNEKDIKKDIERLYQLASELKSEVEKTDSSQVLSLALLRKAEEIEKLAKEIKNRAKG